MATTTITATEQQPNLTPTHIDSIVPAPTPAPAQAPEITNLDPAPVNAKSAQPKDKQKAPPLIPLHQLDRSKEFIECPFCHAQAKSLVTNEASDATNMMACGCCLVIGLLGVWMPFVFNWASNVKHHCSVCKRLVYQRDHNGPVQVFGPESPSPADLKKGYVPVQSMGDAKTAPFESTPAPPYVA